MKLNKKRKGFTLVEIMIVVAIIALLATIAVPNFLRVRKRSQATRILDELRLIENAKDQWALEKNQPGTAAPKGEDLVSYVKAGSDLQKRLEDAATSADVVPFAGNPANTIAIGTVDAPPKVNTATVTEFEDVTGDTDADKEKFWAQYLPAATP